MKKLINLILESKSTLTEDVLLKSNHLYGEGILDSLDILVLMDEIDAEYGTKIGALDIYPEDFTSVQTIYELVQRFTDNTH